MKLTTTGYIKDGAIVFRNLDRFKGEIIESNWTEFSVLIESVIQWAQDTLKITLPLPNTQLQLLDHQK